MFKIPRMIITLLLVPVVVGAGTAVLRQPVWAQETAAEEARLIEVLKSADASLHDKALACKRLAVIGTEKSVPVVAELLTDQTLSHYARFALEPMPTAAADEALRAALDRVQGRLLVGVINSIGNRRDQKAIERLAGYVVGDDAQLAAAAAAALGRIGTPAAAEKLLAALAAATDSQRRNAVADGCLSCADLLLKEGNPQLAAKVYDAVRRADVAEHVRIAGIRGAILARGDDGVDLLGEQLRSEDPAEFAVGLRVARELSASAVTGLLCDLAAQQPPARQAKLLLAAGDRGEKAALPTLLKFVQEGATEARLAAISAVGKLADPDAADVLLKAALDSEEQVAAAARRCLVGLPGNKVDEAILRLLRSDEKENKLLGIQLAGERRVASLTPQLFEAAGSDDADIRTAAVRALGATVTLDEIPRLCERLLEAPGEQDATAAKDALKLAAIRMADADACAAKIAAQLDRAPLEAKVFFLELLRDIGGPVALKAVAASANSAEVAVVDAATRVLGQWLSADVAPVLLDLASSAPREQFRIRCLRGYIRVVRQLQVPDAERVAMCRKAMQAAQRDQERRLVLEALGRIPALDALQMATSYLEKPSLKEAAAGAVVAIAEKLLRTSPRQLVEPLQKVFEVTDNSELKVRAQLFLRRARAAGK